jgi:lipopolysaccharide transport system permease protein
MSAVATRSPSSIGGSARYLRTHGRLLLRVTRNDLHARHAGSHLGIGWIFLGPLLVLAIYSLIYLEIFKVRVTGLSSAEYVIYIFCGLVPYLATAEAMATGVTSVLTNKTVLNNTVFPIDLAPVKAALSAQAIMIAGLAVVLAGAILTDKIYATLLMLPVIWAFHIVWLIGVNWMLSLLNVVFRDLQNLLTALLMIMLVASPIAYTPDMVPNSLRPLLAINPFAYFVVAYQQVIMLGIVPSLGHMVALVAASVFAFALGSWFFGRAKHVIVDYV